MFVYFFADFNKWKCFKKGSIVLVVGNRIFVTLDTVECLSFRWLMNDQQVERVLEEVMIYRLLDRERISHAFIENKVVIPVLPMIPIFSSDSIRKLRFLSTGSSSER